MHGARTTAAAVAASVSQSPHSTHLLLAGRDEEHGVQRVAHVGHVGHQGLQDGFVAGAPARIIETIGELFYVRDEGS